MVREATGSYSIDLTLALERVRGIKVMVANPRAVKSFREAMMQRACTDLSAATALREFAQRMRQAAHISKRGNARLRRVLYMPAIVAKRFNPHVRAFAEHLRARRKCEQTREDRRRLLARVGG